MNKYILISLFLCVIYSCDKEDQKSIIDGNILRTKREMLHKIK